MTLQKILVLWSAIIFTNIYAAPAPSKSLTITFDNPEKNITIKTGHPIYLSHITSAPQAANVVQAMTEQQNVIIDFFAPWCPPCRQLASILDTIAKEFTDIIFLKIDIDQFKVFVPSFRIQGIPVLAFFKGGKKSSQHVGFMDKGALTQMLKRVYGS